ncbi:MAG: phosphopantothenoylcysteine decarboxylase [Xenococcaceae cyanobacterium]
MKKVILSAGPIPAKLDSVKIITNKFKGGLAIKTAEELSLDKDLELEIVKWEGTQIKFHYPDSYEQISVKEIADVYDYRNYILSTSADAYILAGAVANLAPVNPWKGKFPSHNYRVGEEFDITFTIAPRIIDEVKQHYPRSTLLGYKLFDGSEGELIRAGWETLCQSRANVIFCNHPATAKREKIAVMPDGTSQRMSFEEHIEFIKRVINLQWYTTKIRHSSYQNRWQEDMDELLAEIGVEKKPYVFGTVAIRDGNGFITTTRGKRGEKRYCKVFEVDHNTLIVTASQKATMNAPFIERLLNFYPQSHWVIHGHRQIRGVKTYPYSFSGTREETNLINSLQASDTVFNVDDHGYYAVFRSLDGVKKWLHEYREKNS